MSYSHVVDVANDLLSLQSASADYAAAAISSRSIRASAKLRATASLTSLAADYSNFSRSYTHVAGSVLLTVPLVQSVAAASAPASIS